MLNVVTLLDLAVSLADLGVQAFLIGNVSLRSVCHEHILIRWGRMGSSHSLPDRISEAGLTDHVWSLEGLVGLLEQKKAKLAA
jgi:hypothetical protein